jgi:TRAP-type mannitol/chloroaromatic compound transport system permease small subunit
MSLITLTDRTSAFAKTFAYLMVSAVFLFLLNNYLVYWQGLPGPFNLFTYLGWLGDDASLQLSSQQINQGWWQVGFYLFVFMCSVAYALLNTRTLRDESAMFSALSSYLVRAAFWAVLLIGFVDMLISFLRIENFLQLWLSEESIQQLGRPIFRGTYVHYPLLVGSLFIAALFRQISFSWLALLVVLAEFQIVISRFVFSYEQAFMGDLVRFWYAALFLFASAYTLVHEGHVRVDVLYAGFSRAKKAWSNIIGCLTLGIPLCWVILMQGMGGKGHSINSPLLSFEISQSGYGMYVKYLMAGFLVVFALTMIVQFVSYLLHNIAQLTDTVDESDSQTPDSTDSAENAPAAV